ncbi:MAG: FMN-binding glutamate synthase family protein [Thermoplasmata archaeon]
MNKTTRNENLWEDAIEGIKKKAEDGKPLSKCNIDTTKKRTRPFDGLVVVPSQLHKNLPVDVYQEPLETSVIIGENLEKPLLLKTPIFVHADSYGEISRSARNALVYGGSLAGTAVFVSDCFALEEEKEISSKHGGKIVIEYSASRAGINAETLAEADAVEIKLSGGAKPGTSGILPAKKITPTIAKIRNISIGHDAFSPAKHLDMDIPEDIKKHIELIREITDYETPVIVKIGGGDVYNDTKHAINAGADAVHIDCSECFVESLPNVAVENVGVPVLGVFVPAQKAFKETGAKEKGVKLLISGEFMDGGDVYKAVALGGDAVGLSTASRIAIGCNACGLCDTNDCEKGIATNNANLESKLNWEKAGENLRNFLSATSEELNILTALSGCNDIRELDAENLRATTYDVAAITGIKLIGYDKVLPMWSH